MRPIHENQQVSQNNNNKQINKYCMKWFHMHTKFFIENNFHFNKPGA